MRFGIPVSLLFFASLSGFASTDHQVLVIVGAPGEASYAEGFEEAAQAWEEAGQATNAVVDFIGRNTSEASTPKEEILKWIQDLDTESAAPAWIVYIGHGTYNRRDAYLNIKGPDISSKELADWIPKMDRTLIFIHGGSASSPFMSALSGPNRIIISGTRNPDEINYARFGEYFANVLAKSDGDIDQDGQTSLLEAFLTTSDRVESFYTEAGRLSSEHALLDDNGDKLGTPPDWFRGVRVTKRSKTGMDADGFRAHQIALIPSEQEKRLSAEQRQERDALEAEIEVLRKKKSTFQENAYYEMLEAILLKLSNLYFPKDAEGNLIDPLSEQEGS
ncbi:MAG: hypothetical protein O3C43_06950 [Verrucomicrobia bacterium]|nr:hypothetical protein [Verrucomicrobiota bacterium]MDA1066225.1 hypothetical protein [Verrucomicrobiota bacterium]